MFPYAMPYEYKGGGWIKGAVNPAHKGYCTPMTKATCTPRRKAFAMTMKKHHGFHKQDGGEQDQVMQLIQAYAEKTGTDPEQLMAKLQQMPPEEQQQAIQQIQQELQGESENPGEDQAEGGMEEARYGMQIAKDGATPYISFADENAFNSQKDKWELEYLRNHQNRYSDGYERPIREGSVYNYPTGPNNSAYGYFPSNGITPSIKFKNVHTYINGSPAAGGYMANSPNADVYNKFKQFYGDDTAWGKMSVKPRLFGKRYDWEYGVNTPRPGDSSSSNQRSWVGQKLHDIGPNIDKYRTPFPSKKRKQEYADDQAWKAGQPERDAKYAAQKAIEDQQNAYTEASDALPPSRSSAYTPEEEAYLMASDALPPSRSSQYTPEEEAYLMQTDPMTAASTSLNPGPWGVAPATGPYGPVTNPDNRSNLGPYSGAPRSSGPTVDPRYRNEQTAYNALTEAPNARSTWTNSDYPIGSNTSWDQIDKVSNEMSKNDSRSYSKHRKSLTPEEDRIAKQVGFFREHPRIAEEWVNPNYPNPNKAFGGSYQVGGQYDMTQEEIQKLIDGGYEFDYLD
jgi:hypothetical protein